MITVEIKEDGSAKRTWVHVDYHTGKTTRRTGSLSAAEVKSYSKAICWQESTGEDAKPCGTCLICKVKEAVKK